MDHPGPPELSHRGPCRAKSRVCHNTQSHLAPPAQGAAVVWLQQQYVSGEGPPSDGKSRAGKASCSTQNGFPLRILFLELLNGEAQRRDLREDTQEPALTINPGNNKTFKECNPQEAYTASCIVVKELKHIHATL